MPENSKIPSGNLSSAPLWIKFTYCSSFATAETREVEWPVFATAMSTFKVYPSKEASIKRGGFVGGLRADEDKGRADNNIVARTVVTIDYDAPTGTLADIEFALTFGLECAYVAYSTFRHTAEKPRIRLCIPLSRPVNEAEYKAVVRKIVDLLNLGEPDNCSFVMSQIMFLPSRQEDIEPWSMRHDGEPWLVPDVVEGAGQSGVEFHRGKTADDDLLRAVVSKPLDLTPEEIDTLLDNYPAEGKEYDDWARVGMALWHQFAGSEEGWRRWLAWSEKSSKHDSRQMRTKWRSFDGARNPVTMASIIHLAGGLQRAVEIAPTGSTFTNLMDSAARVSSQAEYMALRERVRDLSSRQLPEDMRAMIVGRVYDVYGRAAGLGKRELKSSFRQPKKVMGENNADGGISHMEPPEWLEDWVYNETACSFERLSVRHSIKKEAFRAKFDRMPECEAMGVDAAEYALKKVMIPTVADTMYWPGQGRIFETGGLRYLNTYIKNGVQPCETLQGDADGQAVVDLFLRHVENTIADPREQRILIDWMAFVVQNPGKRVRWTLLLQGIEGNGKSYFLEVMRLVLGTNARIVSSGAIDTQFTGWAEGSVLVGIEEIRIAGTNKYTILDRMKPLLTNDAIAVVHKGKDEKHVQNFTSYMMFTNHADAIPVGDNERRYCMIFTRQTQKQELFDQHGGEAATAAYFDQLFEETQRRADALTRFLMDWEISADFKPNGRAPETCGLYKMRNLNVSEDREAMEEAIEEHACDIIGPDLIDLTYLNSLATALRAEHWPHNKAQNRILASKGYTQIQGRRVKIKSTGKMHFVWFRDGTMTRDQAKEAVSAFHERAKEEFKDPV